jgi:ketosteroid isomerase-like protein
MTNEETIAAAYDAWNRRDVERIVELVHTDCVARPILGANLGANVYRGRDGARRWFQDLHQEWETFETKVTGIEERGECALCTFHVHARGRASGVVIDGDLYHLIEFRDGLIIRLDAFRERDDAVEAFEAT